MKILEKLINKKIIVFSSLLFLYFLSLLLSLIIREYFIVYLSAILFSVVIFSLFLFYYICKKTPKTIIIKKILFLLTIFNLVLFISLRSMWWGIEKTVSIPNLQYLIVCLFSISFIISLLSLITNKIPKIVERINLILSIIFYLLNYYIVDGSIGSIMFVSKDFFDLVSIIIFFIVLYLIIKYIPKQSNKVKKIIKLSTLSLLFLIIIYFIIDSFNNSFIVKPVVYAVNDEYQIIWSTTSPGTGEVIINDRYFYDLTGGSINSNTNIHKVIVPNSLLDEAKSYTVITRNVVYRGPYGGIKGKTIKLTQSFKPVDISDSLNYYSISDTHDFYKHVNININNLDFVILGGDHVSFIDRVSDLLLADKLAYRLTNGRIPVVYARGNHEVKGRLFEELGNYVGSNNDDFFYTFNLGGVFGIVLDMVEDHSDSWYEFYDMARYHEYRLRQLDFLDSLYSSLETKLDSFKYTMVISHVPITVIDKKDQIEEDKKLFISSLERFNLDIMINGHKHMLLPVLSDLFSSETEMNDSYINTYNELLRGVKVVKTNYNAFIVSRRSNRQDIKLENEFGKYMVGMLTEVDFMNNTYKISYLLNNYSKVDIIDPRTGKKVKEFIFNLN